MTDQEKQELIADLQRARALLESKPPLGSDLMQMASHYAGLVGMQRVVLDVAIAKLSR